MEGRLVRYIEDPNAVVTKENGYDFDRLLFDTNEATLRPESHEQLENVAVILRAYPAVDVKVGGYTDATGPSALNPKLSQARAEWVRAELVKRGIAAERIAAEGYGEKFPIGDNATPEGRAMSRRTAIRVTRKSRASSRGRAHPVAAPGCGLRPAHERLGDARAHGHATTGRRRP